MKVFCCKNQWEYGGGLVLVAASTKEEAYLIAAYDDKTSHLFDWADDNYMWCKPDGNINHCTSDTSPPMRAGSEPLAIIQKNDVIWQISTVASL